MSNLIRFSWFTFDALSNIFLIMATNSSKQRRIAKSYKTKYKALKELDKGTRDPNNIFKYAQILAT